MKKQYEKSFINCCFHYYFTCYYVDEKYIYIYKF
jgi:hypothetical protein